MEIKGGVPSVGLAKLDEEHLALFKSSEALKEAACGDMPADQLLQMFENVLRAIAGHFKSEETILAPYRLRNMRPHIEEHASLKAELLALRERAAAGLAESEWRPVLCRLSDRLFDHIVTFDFEVRRHLADYGSN